MEVIEFITTRNIIDIYTTRLYFLVEIENIFHFCEVEVIDNSNVNMLFIELEHTDCVHVVENYEAKEYYFSYKSNDHYKEIIRNINLKKLQEVSYRRMDERMYTRHDLKKYSKENTLRLCEVLREEMTFVLRTINITKFKRNLENANRNKSIPNTKSCNDSFVTRCKALLHIH